MQLSYQTLVAESVKNIKIVEKLNTTRSTTPYEAAVKSICAIF